MTAIAIVMIVGALFLIFSVRHFFLQLLAIKLLVDVLTVLITFVRGVDQGAFNPQTSAIFISAIGALVFFILMAAGIQRFARSTKVNLEVRSE